jgi:hypothetical protein
MRKRKKDLPLAALDGLEINTRILKKSSCKLVNFSSQVNLKEDMAECKRYRKSPQYMSPQASQFLVNRTNPWKFF